jgi:translation elongation factor EF-Ts
MSITLEKIDHIRERANVTYTEAKEALEAAGGNMIDAIILLEKENKTHENGYKNTQQEERRENRKQATKNTADDILDGFKKILKTLNETRVIMFNEQRVVFDVSMTITLLLAAFAFPLTVAILIIGLLTGQRFKISKQSKVSESLNRFFDKASEVTDDVLKNFNQSKDQESSDDDHQA